MKDSLIFEWPGRHHLHLLLPFTILLAALVHGGLFFVFSIVYPHAENNGPEPVQVYFAPPGTADASRLEGVMRSLDPAVFAPGLGLDLSAPFPPVTYIPQYDSDKPVLEPLPKISDSNSPHVSIAGPVPVSREIPSPAGAPVSPAPTRLVSTGPLSGRIPDLPRGTVFPVPQGFDPEPATFLIEVGKDGRITHIFEQTSSGNASLDLRTTNILRNLKFTPDPAQTTWDFVTFQWGADVEPVASP